MLPPLTLVEPVAGVGLTRSISGRRCKLAGGIATGALPPTFSIAPFRKSPATALEFERIVDEIEQRRLIEGDMRQVGAVRRRIGRRGRIEAVSVG